MGEIPFLLAAVSYCYLVLRSLARLPPDTHGLERSGQGLELQANRYRIAHS